MPGIQISTATRTGRITNTVRESSQAFFVGDARRGPASAAVLVTSLEDFEMRFGGYNNSYLHPTVEAFFEEGGTQCYISRAFNTATGETISSSTASVTFDDGTDDMITVYANGPGTWPHSGQPEAVTVEIADGTTVDTTTRIMKIFVGGTLIATTGNQLTAAAMAGRINAHPVAKHFVFALATTEGQTGLPDVTAATALTGGVASDALVDADYVSALAAFGDALGTGVVGCPESTGSTIRNALIAHANTNSRLTFLYPPAGSDTQDALDYAEDVSALDHAEHAAVFYPWLNAPTSVFGVSRTIPPLGYAAGARSRAHNQVGPHQPGAGIISNARFINGVEVDITKSVGDQLDAGFVNAIRVINNTIRIYGARSASLDTDNFRYITGQDVVNHVVVEAYRSLEDVVFTVIDGRNSVFASIEAKLIAILEPLRTLGALYEAFDAQGRRIDYGYTVKCDESLNPLANLADGTLTARVGMRVSSIGDSINVDIVKSNLTASVT
jgi:hypothetical protein